MIRVLAIALLAAACGATTTPSVTASPTPTATTTYPLGWTVDTSEGPCHPETLPTRIDPFALVPYTMDLPTPWLALPPACVTPVSDYRVVPVPGWPARLVVWPPYATQDTREEVFANIEAGAGRPLPSGMVPWVVPPAARRVDLPVGPALEITFTSPATDRSHTPSQSLQYTVWHDGNVLSYDFSGLPESFVVLEPLFRMIAESIRLKAPAPS